MFSTHNAAFRTFVLPGGLLLLAAAVLVHTDVVALALPGLLYPYYAALIVGALLAWRFHASRVFFVLLVLFLAQQALVGPSAKHWTSSSTVVGLVGILLPLNLVLLSLAQERGFTAQTLTTTVIFFFVQSVVVVGVLAQLSVPASHSHHLGQGAIPGYALFAFTVAAIVLLVRFFLSRKPVDSALFWSLAASFLALHFGGIPRIFIAYWSGAVFILAVSIVETSYLLAYHDELTTLPSRRAFNDALAGLQAPYSIAMVDIDHFKKFNDTYGHDTGDQVLRLVASRLARVTGEGKAYRCGGEEFAVLFPGKTTRETLDHLEVLRATIESSSFRMRGADRRQTHRGPDRRNQPARGRAQAGRAIRQLAGPRGASPLSVTVSIGVATSTSEETRPDQVVLSADKALYRAKNAGRNRVEAATPGRHQPRAKTAGIA